ncbi:hypothetical protein [uncultured Shewanella sp.]|uniref:hypothetical protein n=1 Tax=uncultured Shewanella sp. TaxID=173975 RepID=UPI00260400B6|nr:hypothetical protein [uncultured Shewanella sp.]
MVYFFIAVLLLAIYFSARTSYMAYKSDLLEQNQVYLIFAVSWLVPFVGALLISSVLKPELSSREEAVKSMWDWIFWFNPQEQPNVFPSEDSSQMGSSVGDGDH